MIDMINPHFEQWLKLQNEVLTRQKKDKSLHGKKFVGDRGYLHFDGRINIKRLDGSNKADPAYRLLSSNNAIASHPFLPFLREDERVRKYRDKPAITLEGNPRLHHQRYPTIKNRPIMYASHVDASIFSLYNNIIGTKYEEIIQKEGLENNVIAYRPVPITGTERNKSNIDFATELYQGIKDFDGDAGILLLDITGFFDNLNHKRLYEKWCRTLGVPKLPDDHNAIYKNITSFRYVHTADAYKALGLDKEALKMLRHDRRATLCNFTDFNKRIKKQNLIHKNNSGKAIPQGSPISGLLANMYMLDFDIKVKALVQSLGGTYMRYSDDIAILVEPSKLIGTYEAIQRMIKEEGLTISTKKTDCFIYQKKPNSFVNVIRKLEPKNTLNLKFYPQYLGFIFMEDNVQIRGNTLARRFRGGKAFLLKTERWKYFSLSTRKTNSPYISAQVEGVRRKIKPIVQKAQDARTQRNRERRGEASS